MENLVSVKWTDKNLKWQVVDAYNARPIKTSGKHKDQKAAQKSLAKFLIDNEMKVHTEGIF